uniref:Uncharacterized protein n=1 Tax=Arundo donax TaxID=35708 RepID=A0A0A8Z1L4_ARUDO
MYRTLVGPFLAAMPLLSSIKLILCNHEIGASKIQIYTTIKVCTASLFFK